jgi:GNAT superfamily N-acetyltransferase
MSAPCPVCGCTDVRGGNAHGIAAALAEDDIDRAIEAGLLSAVPCATCNTECTARIVAARDARLSALAARERYRARQARLLRRAEERAAARAVPVVATTMETKPALPSAAAAALARAKARAAERRKP